MTLNVTAIYRTYGAADLVRSELLDLGVGRSDIHVVPDRDVPASAGGYRDDTAYTDQLHALHLPEEDLRTYQHSVRRGDYVVSAEVDDTRVERVKEIMRHPEAQPYAYEGRSAEFRNEKLVPHSAGDRYVLDEDRRARPLSAEQDPYSRTYERKSPLGGSRRNP